MCERICTLPHGVVRRRLIDLAQWILEEFPSPSPSRRSAGNCAPWRAFLEDETAATAIEYGLIAAGIALAIITVVKGVGTKLNTTFSSISTQLK